MRYSGGLLGGSWLTALTGDLGHGKFDGAWLVQNFEADPPRCAQAGLAGGHFTHELVRVQATLHQELALGLMDELNCLRGRRLAVRYVDNLKTIDVQAKPARYGGNLRRRADKNWDDDASFGRFDGTAQGRLIAWVNDDCFR